MQHVGQVLADIRFGVVPQYDARPVMKSPDSCGSKVGNDHGGSRAVLPTQPSPAVTIGTSSLMAQFIRRTFAMTWTRLELPFGQSDVSALAGRVDTTTDRRNNAKRIDAPGFPESDGGAGHPWTEFQATLRRYSVLTGELLDVRLAELKASRSPKRSGQQREQTFSRRENSKNPSKAVQTPSTITTARRKIIGAIRQGIADACRPILSNEQKVANAFEPVSSLRRVGRLFKSPTVNSGGWSPPAEAVFKIEWVLKGISCTGGSIYLPTESGESLVGTDPGGQSLQKTGRQNFRVSPLHSLFQQNLN